MELNGLCFAYIKRLTTYRLLSLTWYSQLETIKKTTEDLSIDFLIISSCQVFQGFHTPVSFCIPH